MFERIAHIPPRYLAAGGAIVAALSFFSPTTTQSPAVEGILTGIAVLIIYGYPLWVVFGAPLPLVRAARKTAVVGFAVLGVVPLLILALGPISQTDQPLWRVLASAMFGVAVFLPQGAAATTLRRAELQRGRDIPLGWMSAFIWLLFSFIGWYALHRRVRVAAGLEPWPTSSSSVA